jgi:hypothetical protein
MRDDQVVDIILGIFHKQSIDRTDDSRRARGMASGNSGLFWWLTLFLENARIGEKRFFLGERRDQIVVDIFSE